MVPPRTPLDSSGRTWTLQEHPEPYQNSPSTRPSRTVLDHPGPSWTRPCEPPSKTRGSGMICVQAAELFVPLSRI